jgi:hypothetical protein
MLVDVPVLAELISSLGLLFCFFLSILPAAYPGEPRF